MSFDSLPSVFAIIPSFNRKEKTVRFLERFTQQTYENLHIVIVDADSMDGTKDEISSNYPNVILINVDNECYWTASTNCGVSFALDNEADFILTINDDSFVAKNYVEDLVDLAIKYEINILGSRIDYMDKPGCIWSLGAYCDWEKGNILQLSHNQVWFDDLPDSVRDKDLIPADALAGNGVLIRRNVFEKIGLYNEKYLPHYHSDSEFILRAVKNDIFPSVATEVVVYNDCVDSFEEPQYTLKEAIAYPFRFSKNFVDKRTHVYYLPVFYVISKYCPLRYQVLTLLSFFVAPAIIPLKKAIQIRSRTKRFVEKLLRKVSS